MNRFVMMCLVLTLMIVFAISSNSAVTSGNSNSYVSLHGTNGGDTIISATNRVDFTLGGDLIGEFTVGGTQLSAGFWPFGSTRIDTTAPTVFTLTAPAHRSETNAAAIRFSWNASIDSRTPVFYKLQISRDTAFSDLAYKSIGISGLSCSAVLPGNSRYLWRVVASDTFGNTRNSDTRGLTVDTNPPAAPQLLAPDDSASITALLVDYRWLSASDSLPALPTLYSAVGLHSWRRLPHPVERGVGQRLC